MTGDGAGPGRGSWRVVWRALRTGHVDDPRYETLTRETADRNVRNVWLPVFLAVCVAVQAALVVVRIARDADPFGTVAIAAGALFTAIGLGVIWVARRRSRRYLENIGAHPRAER